MEKCLSVRLRLASKRVVRSGRAIHHWKGLGMAVVIGGLIFENEFEFSKISSNFRKYHKKT